VSRGRELSVTTTILGTAPSPILRSGARPGDDIWLIGDVGLARAGFLCATRRLGRSNRRSIRSCVVAWREPRALLAEGLRLRGRAHAAIDVSDGLAGDAGHIAEESRVALILEERRLRRALRPELVEVASLLGEDPLDLALSGGEDYALVVTGPRSAKPRGARIVGHVTKGRGVHVERLDGTVTRAPTGFDHFSGR
jgi:thiamine-monophosphate kinase